MNDPATRKPTRRLLHTRHIVCSGYERSDGLFDIEARLTDIKADTADLLYKQVPAGEPLHDLRITLTIDATGLIRRANASTDTGPSPYCAQINAAYESLAGVRIAAGFRQQVKERVGGKHGCTHLTELLGPLATTALQTLMGTRPGGGDADAHLAQMTDTCHAWRADGEVVRFVRKRRSETSRDRDAAIDAEKPTIVARSLSDA
ncbi:DUF2889 domain-containing protein [Paraburkholderia caribensis]|uniref:DUF2889 domain-containing protein n=1 Tax=Paraburkholderia caribensis TaxID=75105 RepID=UPI001CB130FE|nr:DUF2889 domain-containing protein [Paraburkholderia caribensis]CAG9248770.1 conserved hypothetical protein [Paraburkholderia caribensis]